MADDKLNVNPALPQDGDDTVTRKTIKLRPAMMPGAPVVTPAVSPRPAANTDTGSIDLADDTQTRRTIKLKPVSPIQVTPIAPAPVAPAAAPAAASAAPAAAAPVAEPAAPAADGDDTVTRKTIKLRPAVPGAVPAAPAAEPAAPAAMEDSGEKTIRIQRPVIKPVTGPAVSPSPVSAAPIPAIKPAPQMPAVKMPTLQKPESPAAVPTQALPPPTGVEEEYDETEFVPSKACLIMSIIALICMIYSTLLITVQFLDVTQNQKTAESVSFLVPGSK